VTPAEDRAVETLAGAVMGIVIRHIVNHGQSAEMVVAVARAIMRVGVLLLGGRAGGAERAREILEAEYQAIDDEAASREAAIFGKRTP
jgi:hypothetical protein